MVCAAGRKSTRLNSSHVATSCGASVHARPLHDALPSFSSRGLISKRDVVRSAYTQFVYLLGGADHDQTERMRAYLSSLVTGWPVTRKDKYARMRSVWSWSAP